MADERIPPQEIEAEQSVLGAMLQATEALHTGIEMLKEDNFYLPKHRKIFGAIRKEFEKNNAVDIITISANLSSLGHLEEIGGRRYLMDLTDSVVTFSNTEDHAKLILDASVKNNLIDNSSEIINRAYDPSWGADELLDFAERKVLSARQGEKAKIQSVHDILPDAFNELCEWKDGKTSGILSGFKDLDQWTMGFLKKDFVLIASRPSVGKTSLLLDIAFHAASVQKIPVLIFSLEMAKNQLAQRMICAQSEISLHAIRSGRVGDEGFKKLSDANALISDLPIYIDDSAILTPLEMRARARRYQSKENIGLVMLDYIQKMSVPGARPENRQQEMSYISSQCKALSKELAVPVVAAAQLSRSVENRGKEERPRLSDIRESGTLEQDSDTIIFLHRVRGDDGLLGSKCEVIIGKQRNGPTATVNLTFRKDCSSFAAYHEEPQEPDRTEPKDKNKKIHRRADVDDNDMGF